MAILPVPVSHSKFVIAQRKLSHIVVLSSVAATTIAAKTSTARRRPNQVLQLINPKVAENQVLFKDQYTNVIDVDRELAQRNLGTGEGEGLGNEVRMMMERLERVSEGMREMELEKLKKGRLRGDVSHEDSLMLEMMSREIVSSFLEKPIQYLNGGDGKLEDRLKDLNFFVGILEQSCFTNQKVNTDL